MTTLAKIQHDFIHAFYNDDSATFMSHIVGDARLSAEKRLQIYQNSIKEGLAIHLRKLYSPCEKVVGEDFFTAMAYQFIKQTPCHTPDLAQYGDSFPTFVDQFPPAKALPYLSDLCQLCWHWHCCSQKQTVVQFDVNAFATVLNQNSDDLTLTLQPSLYLLQSPFPLDQIWALCFGKDDSHIDLQSGGVYLGIWYNGAHITLDKLTKSQWQVAQLISQKLPLSTLQKSCEKDKIDLLALLPSFLEKGWLAGWQLA